MILCIKPDGGVGISPLACRERDCGKGWIAIGTCSIRYFDPSLCYSCRIKLDLEYSAYFCGRFKTNKKLIIKRGNVNGFNIIVPLYFFKNVENFCFEANSYSF